MTWNLTPTLAPFAGRFAHAALIDRQHPQRTAVEAFIAAVYEARYGARLRHFLPHLVAYWDASGALVAAVGIRLGDEGALFVEQYLESHAEHAMAQRLAMTAPVRASLAEVGNFAARTPGAARELIVQLTCLLHAAQVRWVLFAATRQLRNAFERLQLSPVELAEARPDRLHDAATDWGRYYDTQPWVMCGNVALGHAYLLTRQTQDAVVQPQTGFCLAGAL